MRTFIFILTLISLCACGKSDDVVLNPIDTIVDRDSLLIWQVPLKIDSSLASSMDTELYGSGILYSSQSLEYNENEEVRMSDVANGELIWAWEGYISSNPGQQVVDRKILGDILAINTYRYNYVLSPDDGQSLWSTTTEKGNPYISNFENVIFHTTQNGEPWPRGDSTSVLFCDADKGNWQEILKFHQSDFEGYEITFHSPAAFVNDAGDTLLILKLEQITIAPFDSRLDLYCYNMTQDTMVWGHRQFDPYGGANIRPPLIEGDYVYYVGIFEVYCLNKNTGEVQWKWGYPETRHSLRGNNFLLYQDKLIIKRGNGLLYALDKHTGAEQWVQEDAGSSDTEMRIYGNRLYFGSGKIFIIDLDTGETIYKIRTPNLSSRFPYADFVNAITVDEVNQRMYTTDGYFLMCMRLPE